MSHLCAAYGLVIQADSFIPGASALPSAARPDLCIRLGEMPAWRDEAVSTAQVRYITPYENDCGESVMQAWDLAGGKYLRLRYADSTEFILDGRGTQVWVTWPQSQTLEDMATYLLGPVLGLVLRLRGLTCLHASAVALGGQAIALAGSSGAGKSTTAAAFAQAGCQILADDIVVLDEQRSGFWVRSAYPRLRLWPEAVKALFGADDALPRLTPSWDKRYLDLLANGRRFQAQPLPLAAIYLLGQRAADPAAPFIEAVAANDALMTLVANTYATHLLDKRLRAAEFQSLGRLCARVPLRRVTPHEDITHLPKLCEVVLGDFRTTVLPRGR